VASGRNARIGKAMDDGVYRHLLAAFLLGHLQNHFQKMGYPTNLVGYFMYFSVTNVRYG
jgi:hypothetical protein